MSFADHDHYVFIEMVRLTIPYTSHTNYLSFITALPLTFPSVLRFTFFVFARGWPWSQPGSCLLTSSNVTRHIHLLSFYYSTWESQAGNTFK